MDSTILNYGDQRKSKKVLIGRGYRKESTYTPQSGQNKGKEIPVIEHYFEPSTVIREDGQVKMVEKNGKQIPALKRIKGSINLDDVMFFKSREWTAKNGQIREDFYCVFKEPVALD